MFNVHFSYFLETGLCLQPRPACRSLSLPRYFALILGGGMVSVTDMTKKILRRLSMVPSDRKEGTCRTGVGATGQCWPALREKREEEVEREEQSSGWEEF